MGTMKVCHVLALGLLFACCLAQTTEDCLNSYHNLTKTQMAEMIDYTGKAIDDMGNYDGCQELPADKIHYCVAQTRVGVGKADESISVYMGLCTPAVCTAEVLQELMYKYINKSAVHLPANYSIDGELANLGVTCIPRGWQKLTPGAIITLCVFAFIALLVFGGTMLEYVDDQMALKQTIRHNRVSPAGPYDEIERKPLVNSNGVLNDNTTVNADGTIINGEYTVPKRRPGKFAIFLKCFAIKANLEFLLKDNRSSETGLAAMNGLRCLMMFWIILGHTFGYLNTPVGFDNSVLVTKHVIERVSFQVVFGAELAVDVFFYLSGFLVVYMVLKEMKKDSKKPIPWGLFYFHRYWRLTPVYGFIILAYTTLTPFMIYGPFSYLYRGSKTDLCDKYWWTNLLYINNFYPKDSAQQCLGWGWYLANDMQFFIFTPFIIILYKKSRPLAVLLLLMLYILCITLVGVLTDKHHLRPLDPGDDSWMTIVYNKPYTRMAPYLIGIAFAFLVQHENVDLLRSWPVRWIVYIICATGTTLSTYMTYGFWRGDWHTWQNVVYACCARSVFVFGTAIFMYACFKGHGGILRSILSVYMWLPIARLTYTAYLVHPIIMFVINFSATTNFHYSAIYAGVRYSSHIFMAYVLGLVFHLAIEKPTANLERLLLPPRRH
eukprot:Phypoly_transcript_02091.p1 GENE.Phypoly_transcript_02091~~Phypoly_transcript_02091.p1  ORF type:complete len:662 (+),score=60.51 Phypoly_transcript_02091:96-2081(+)